MASRRQPGASLRPSRIRDGDDRTHHHDLGPSHVETGSAGNDIIDVTQLPDGSLEVTVNGVTYTMTPEEAEDLVIETGAGDDIVTIDTNVTVGITIDGGRGNDTIYGGDGHDDITGGDGDDLVSGGEGDDKSQTWIDADGNEGTGSDGTAFINVTGKLGDGGILNDTPPSIITFHELLHNQDYVNGTLERGKSLDPGNPHNHDTNPDNDDFDNNRELDVVGLDHDPERNGTDPGVEPNTRETTENSFRADLGYDDRTQY